MTYRAAPVTQRDGSELANSNCLMAAAATGLDFHTLGAKTSTGSRMRDYSGDTSGGTNTDEIERAWKNGYTEDPTTRDGRPWSDVLDDLDAGRLVMLQVWHATVGGPCLSGSGQYGHGLAVAPERNGSRYLVSDPWCKPPKWVWVSEALLKAGAVEWADRCAREAGGRRLRDIPRAELLLIIKALFALWTPEHPNPRHDPPEVGGAGGVLFASTRPQSGADDMSINTNGSRLETVRRFRLTAQAGFYADAQLTEHLGDIAEGHECQFVGPANGTNSNAILYNTGKPYSDGDKRWTIVYVIKDKCGEPYQVEPAPPPDTAARDAAWRAWLEDDAHAPDRA